MDEHRRKTDLERLNDAVLRRPYSRRGILKAAIITPAAAALAACSKNVGGGAPSPQATSTSAALEDELNIYNWARYLNPEEPQGVQERVLDRAPRRTSTQQRGAHRQAQGRRHRLRHHRADRLRRGDPRQDGLALELDSLEIPNLSNADPQFLGAGFDPDNRTRVPKDWGTTGVGFLTDHVTRTSRAGRSSSTSRRSTAGSTRCWTPRPRSSARRLKLLGYQLQLARRRRGRRGHRQADLIKGDIAAMTSSQYRQMMQREETYVALGWNGDFFYVKKPHKYVIPSEGSEFWLDNWCIPASAPAPQPRPRVPELDPHARAPGDGERATRTTRAA